MIEEYSRNLRRTMMEGKVDEKERRNDETRANLAMERLNFIHGQYNIKQGDYLHTLAAIVQEPALFMERFEWRPMTDLEKNGSDPYRDLSQMLFLLLFHIGSSRSFDTLWLGHGY